MCVEVSMYYPTVAIIVDCQYLEQTDCEGNALAVIVSEEYQSNLAIGHRVLWQLDPSDIPLIGSIRLVSSIANLREVEEMFNDILGETLETTEHSVFAFAEIASWPLSLSQPTTQGMLVGVNAEMSKIRLFELLLP